jgi:hypothetical protein
MKAMKIASGFAVTALATAIAGQAAAADFEMSASGAVSALVIMDLDAETKKLVAADADNRSSLPDDTYSLELNIGVSNGPFSANVVIDDDFDGADADGSQSNANNGTVTAEDANTDGVVDYNEIDVTDDSIHVAIEDIMITDGAFSAGQVGDVAVVQDLLRATWGDNDKSDYINDVSVAMRYTNADAGVVVQLENNEDTAFGLGASYSADLGTAKVMADLQLDLGEDDGDTEDAAYGVGIEAAPSDTVSVQALYMTDSTDSLMLGKVTVALGDYSVWARYKDEAFDPEDDTDAVPQIALGGSGNFGGVKASAAYFMNDNETAELALSGSAPAGPGSVSASYNMGMEDSTYSYYELAYAMKSENGVLYKLYFQGLSDEDGQLGTATTGTIADKSLATPDADGEGSALKFLATYFLFSLEPLRQLLVP